MGLKNPPSQRRRSPSAADFEAAERVRCASGGVKLEPIGQRIALEEDVEDLVADAAAATQPMADSFARLCALWQDAAPGGAP
jgi:hypothetical protein